MQKNTASLIEKILKPLLKEHDKKVQDIYVFGSFTRGKNAPGDVDLLVLFRDEIDLETVSRMRKKLPDKYGKFELVPLTYEELLSPSFRPRADILSDAVSVKFGEKLCNRFGYNPYSIFIFSLKNLSNSERVKFHYALTGRGDKKGLADEIGAFRLADGALGVPVGNSESLKSVLEHWKIDYTEIKALTESRLEKLLLGRKNNSKK